MRAVIGAAEELNTPVIIMHAQVHEEMGLCKMDEIAPIMLFYGRPRKSACVRSFGPRHGYRLRKRGIDLGFTSVMYDGSECSLDLNRANTCIIKEIAARENVSVEAEVGSMGARESGEKRRRKYLYRPGKSGGICCRYRYRSPSHALSALPTVFILKNLSLTLNVCQKFIQ